MKSPKKSSDLQSLIRAISTLDASVRRIHTDMSYYGNILTGVWQSFVKGIAYGLGALVAVAIVTPIVLWFLSQIAWPPLVAGFVSSVIFQVQQVNPPLR